jgi:hypothetical protein
LLATRQQRCEKPDACHALLGMVPIIVDVLDEVKRSKIRIKALVRTVARVDEVGVGALAGPVVAAAV